MLLFRLNFDIFNIGQPDTNVYTANCVAGQSCLTNSRTQCQRAQFMASQDGPAAPTICGTNTGYHMILEAEDNCNVLTFTWDSDSTREWNIHISQILCSDPHKPPQGCLQYFTGTTGNIASYNFQGGTHLANQVINVVSSQNISFGLFQRYNNCIRQEYGFCTISYSTATNDFQVKSRFF